METDMQWAVKQYGGVHLGDVRRSMRAVQIAVHMARRPADMLPAQMEKWKDQKAAYRFLDNPAVSHEALSQPHWEATRREGSGEGKTTLMIQDITELDYTAHQETEGLGPIGNYRGQGMYVHTTLAVEAAGGTVLGLAYQQAWVRENVRHKGNETRTQRSKRKDKQSERWVQAVKMIGKAPAETRWVHVADRECDIYDFFEAVHENDADFCVRIVQNRRVGEWEEEDPHYLISDIQQLPAMGTRMVEVPAKAGQSSRNANLSVSWQEVVLRSPRNRSSPENRLGLWAIRVWESSPPPEVEAIEWLLLTSVPVEKLEDAQERILWYTYRWLVEEYHSCLKTGCSMEKRQLQDGARLQRLLGFLAILAVRLLQLRDVSRTTPNLRAVEVVQPVLVQIMAYQTKKDPNSMTMAAFWRSVGQIGGFPGRKSDGQPGWKRLWHGWLRLLDWADGVHFAQNLPPLQDVGNP